jgi:hypothetical protein
MTRRFDPDRDLPQLLDTIRRLGDRATSSEIAISMFGALGPNSKQTIQRARQWVMAGVRLGCVEEVRRITNPANGSPAIVWGVVKDPRPIPPKPKREGKPKRSAEMVHHVAVQQRIEAMEAKNQARWAKLTEAERNAVKDSAAMMAAWWVGFTERGRAPRRKEVRSDDEWRPDNPVV